MRIAIAGFMHESNTFNTTKTDRAAFAAQSLTIGPEMLGERREAHHEVGGFFEAARKLDVEARKTRKRPRSASAVGSRFPDQLKTKVPTEGSFSNASMSAK